MLFRPTLAALALLGACGAPEREPTPPDPQPTLETGARLTIMVPAPHVKGLARPYISTATRSLSLTIKQGMTQVVQTTVNLTPTSDGCAATMTGTECVVKVKLQPGSYSASLSTFSGLDAGGDLLSSGQSLPLTVVSGVVNDLALTLSGVPDQIAVTRQGPYTTGDSAGGFTLPGLGPKAFKVQALDASGAVIVGPGAPSFAVSVESGSGWTVAGSADTVTVTPPGSDGASGTIKVAATFTDGTCALPSAVCSVTFAVHGHTGKLFVARSGGSGDGVDVYAPPYTGAPTQLGGHQIIAIALDSQQNLVVTNFNQNLAIYAPPYTGSPILAPWESYQMIDVSLDSHDNIFATVYQGWVSELSAPYTNGVVRQINGDTQTIFSASIDPSDNLVIPISTGAKILAPPAYDGTPILVPMTRTPVIVRRDAAGVVLAALPYPGGLFPGGVYRYAPPYDTEVAIALGIIHDFTTDGLGTYFVARYPNELVITDGGANSVTRTDVNFNLDPYGSPQLLTLGPGGDLFVANSAGSSINVYSPPYTGAPIVVATGSSVPRSVRVSP